MLPRSLTWGSFPFNENDDTIWVKMTSTSQGECPWPWSYGLFTWITENGRELGTVKVNGVCEGEVFRLGVGLAPEFRTGRLGFTPRNYNLKWIELGNPWYLTFSFKTGQEQAAGPELVGGSTFLSHSLRRSRNLILSRISRLRMPLRFFSSTGSSND